ncbi:MAG TPA: CBS domain-containing protein [Acidimicrobiales bacterium]|jgi:CBS domain-containing protein
MPRLNPLPSPSRLRERRHQRSRRLLASRAVSDTLVSVAGVIGRPVRNPSNAEIGTVKDIVARWDGGEYPPVTAIVVRVGRRLAFVPVAQIESLAHHEVGLRSARLDLADFERREGEVLLAQDVIDHQLVDVDGVRVIRAADLYVAKVGTMYRLVGVDVSAGTLLRRLGPTRWRARATPERVIDWAAIQPFGRPGSPIRLREGNRALHRLRPSELADLLEELGRRERQDLLAALEPETAADALEEMDAEELESLLRESGEEQASALLAVMEPDEAVDALRDLEHDERNRLLGMMPEDKAAELRRLLRYEEHTAGGLMTSYLLLVRRGDTVADVRARLVDDADHRADLPGVLVVDPEGRLIDDVSLFELLAADPDITMNDLCGEPWPVTVTPDAEIDDVVERFVDERGSSLVVVDEEERPLGRILADDLIDALAPQTRVHARRRLA